MITPEEEQRIIDKAVEKALLALPDVLGNMMVQNALLLELNKKFYEDHPEFKTRKDVVASVVEMIDAKNPGLKYEEILEKATPEIRKRLDMVKGIDVKDVSKPTNLTYNGEL